MLAVRNLTVRRLKLQRNKPENSAYNKLQRVGSNVSLSFCRHKSVYGKIRYCSFSRRRPCAMLWLPKLFGKRCIATIHGLDHQRAKWGKLASTYIMMGEKCAVKHADEIIVLSKGVQDYFRETYSRETKIYSKWSK